nr:MAG TPA: hypothetical protein [Bacteriophage sp.]
MCDILMLYLFSYLVIQGNNPEGIRTFYIRMPFSFSMKLFQLLFSVSLLIPPLHRRYAV